MCLTRRFYLVLSLITCLLQAQGADKYTDENRPYEFGFNIEGEQHRHEKKDENGIIMGEFGFITADGVYHVTVYATDENGNFKILSMKNIRVKPYPSTAVKKPQGKSLTIPPSENAAPAVPQNQPSPAVPSPASPAKSCSHCSIPTTTTKAPPLNPASVSIVNLQNSNYNTGSQNPQQPNPNNIYSPQNLPQQNNPSNNAVPNTSSIAAQNYPQQQSTGENYNQNYPLQPNNPSISGQIYPQQQSPGENYGQNYPQEPNNPSIANYPVSPGTDDSQSYIQGNGSPENNAQQPSQYAGVPNPESRFGGSAGERNPKQFNPNTFGSQGQQPSDYNPQDISPQSNQAVTKPQLISAQMQIVDKNTDIYHRGPGENEGLPNGITKDDMTQLLYTFNYTVGFHGHHEEGYRNGAKKGYYYVTGRNGIRTRVDYEADEKGFRPKITQEVLDLLSDEVPKPETEKEEKYGLKGYEFKWLYYPVDSRKR